MPIGVIRISNAVKHVFVGNNADLRQETGPAFPQSHLDLAADALSRRDITAAGQHLNSVHLTPALLASPDVQSAFRSMGSRMVRCGEADPKLARTAFRTACNSLKKAQESGMPKLSFTLLAASIQHYKAWKSDTKQKQAALADILANWAESAEMKPNETMDWTRYLLDGMKHADRKTTARDFRRLLRAFRADNSSDRNLLSSADDCSKLLERRASRVRSETSSVA